MEIRFHGACRTVTGSLHEVRAGGKRLLLDVGMFQGPRAVAARINCCFDFDPKGIDAVILSHGHTDHCGNLPNLVKQGYGGPIYCTPATAAVTTLMLRDSAKIQEEDAEYLNQKTDKSWQGEIKPLYTKEDAEETIRRFSGVAYRSVKDLDGASFEFRDAGHALGSAAVRVSEAATGKRLVFTGDVGRPGSPLVKDPDVFDGADAVITECTYGGRKHAAMAEVPHILAKVVNDTAHNHGVLMVPAFALGRSQAMIEMLHELIDRGEIPRLSIFVDSPLATKLTQVHRDFAELLDEETRAMLTPFDYPELTYVASPQESRALNFRRGAFIVIAGSGMCESGRILHHLKHHIADGHNTVLMPGYQAENTLGRRLQDGQKMVNILGDRIPVRCRVETLHGLSAHADGGELIGYSQTLKGAPFYLVHGEVAQATAHAAALMAAGFAKATIATRGDVVTV